NAGVPKMARKNLAIAKENQSEETEKPQELKIAKAAETVSTELDKIIHERMRLGIISAHAANKSLSFTDLKNLLKTTDGNISVHARKLEDAGYLTCEKSFNGRVPLTEYRITSEGKQALEKYLNHMEALISAMRNQ
ncbi:MAG TPA: transcriptional regulator, partial [Pyrinomonadaceae bacterium]|nr:transcriptional regulator [Pyrinomonadaceae bacterium]